MIFYTLQGPNYRLEIHHDKILLIKKPWLRVFSRKNKLVEYKLSELAEFRVASTKKMMTGRLEWSTFDGNKGTFSFSTNSRMMEKIERYIHKLIVKNNNSRSAEMA